MEDYSDNSLLWKDELNEAVDYVSAEVQTYQEDIFAMGYSVLRFESDIDRILLTESTKKYTR